jgi:hypothetical protein
VIFDPLPYATNLRRENEAELQRTGLRHELALLEARQIALRIKQASPQTRRVILSIHVDLGDHTLVPPHLRRRIEETGVDLI